MHDLAARPEQAGRVQALTAALRTGAAAVRRRLPLTAAVLKDPAWPLEKFLPQRPNILWLVSEDNDTFLGCYGDPLARTPTLDRLAREGVLYEHCFAGPVCAPSRFTLITGMYAVDLRPGRAHAGQGKIPAWLKGFPGLPARGRLLHVEQRQDRLQLAHQHQRGLEPVQRQGPLAEPRAPASRSSASSTTRSRTRAACSRSKELPLAFPVDRPGQGPHSALSARHAGDAGRLGPVLQPHDAAGQPDRRQAQGPGRQTAWPTTRSSSTTPTTAACCRGANDSSRRAARTCR